MLNSRIKTSTGGNIHGRRSKRKSQQVSDESEGVANIIGDSLPVTRHRKRSGKYDHEVAGCVICHTEDNPDSILLCDICNKEFHLNCLEPPLSQVPAGDWFCPGCIVSNGVSLEGRKARIFWTEDDAWYDCIIIQLEPQSGRHQLVYLGKKCYQLYWMCLVFLVF